MGGQLERTGRQWRRLSWGSARGCHITSQLPQPSGATPPHHGAEASETRRQASVDHVGHRILPHAANLTPSAYSKHFPPGSHGDYYELSLRLWLITASSINGPQLLHLPALRNHHIRGRPIQYTPHILDLPDHVHPLHDFPKRHILAVQKRRRLARDKELAAVRIRTGTTPIH